MIVDQPSSFRHALKLRVEDYLLLADAGSLADYPGTELIDGTIIVVSPVHRPHARAVLALARPLADQLEQLMIGLEALFEPSVEMPPRSMPRPDIVVTDEPSGEGFVPVGSVRLLLEVADSTLADDLGPKAQLYAEQGVPEYWVVDLPARRVHQLWNLTPQGYAARRVVAFGGPIQAVTIAGLRVSTDGLARL